MPTVYLVDASPYIFRAYYSVPTRVTAPDGRPVNAVHGFTDFLIQLLKASPTHMAIAFDGSLTTSFRNQIYPEYKAQRESPPAELKAQIGLCRQIAQAMNIVTFIDKEYESDDLIGTMVAQLARQGAECVIVSSDKDFAQLVSAKVTLWDFARNRRFDCARVLAKFGVAPEQIVDLFALMGDSVDNIPGIKGVGPKAASALLSHFHSLDGIYSNLEAVSQLPIRGARSLRERVASGRDMAFLSKRLVTIAQDAPVQVTLEQLEVKCADRNLLEPLFDDLGFENIKGRILCWSEATLPPPGQEK